MQIPEELMSQLRQLHGDIALKNVSSIHGGDINLAYRLDTTHGSFFAKFTASKTFPDVFQKEAKGLLLLSECSALYIPKVICFGENSTDSWLVLEWLESAGNSTDYWQALGSGLAQMHRETANQFGLDHNNYIGRLPQNNTQHDAWSTFYAGERLEPLVRLARNASKLLSSDVKSFERLYKCLNAIYPNESPALLHGDLWSGNVSNTVNNVPIVFDPAVYYGHREMDLAMTRLFGGFANGFYTAYINSYPLEKGWEQRVKYSQLYPLLVHLNLFGGNYLNSIQGILKEF